MFTESTVCTTAIAVLPLKEKSNYRSNILYYNAYILQVVWYAHTVAVGYGSSVLFYSNFKCLLACQLEFNILVKVKR